MRKKKKAPKVKRSPRLARRSWAKSKAAIGLVLLFLVTFSIAVSVSSVDSVTPDTLREQTVHVLAFSGEEEEGSGSGVVLLGNDGSNYVFTAAHCVPDSCDQRMVVEVHPLLPALPLVQLETEIVWVDRQRDFALLKVRTPYFFSRYATPSPMRPKAGQWVQHVGFMQGHSLPHAYARGLVSCWDSKAAKWLSIGCDAAAIMAMPGSSGGPVFDSNGKLVGILVGVTPFGAAFYVPLFQVSESLRESGLSLSF